VSFPLCKDDDGKLKTPCAGHAAMLDACAALARVARLRRWAARHPEAGPDPIDAAAEAT